MYEMITIKLNNGADIVGHHIDTFDGSVTINNPIEMQVDPEYGFFAKRYMLLIDSDTATFKRSDIIIMGPSSEKAVKYYKQFVDRLAEIQSDDNDDQTQAFIESQNSIKH